jgi:uncharacterized protein (DUF4415 family)
MPKLKPMHIKVSKKEDAEITSAALSDPDAIPLNDLEWEQIKPLVKLGRPKSDITKERITIRLSRDVVNHFRSSGAGWQTRMDLALKDYITQHPLSS